MIASLFAFSTLISLTQSLVVVPRSYTTLPGGSGCQSNDFTGSNTIMTCSSEHTLKKGAVLIKLPKVGKKWKMSLDFKPLKKPDSEKKLNIIQLSDSTSTRINPDYAGIFSIWTFPNQHLHFSYAESDDKSWSTNYNGTQVGHWTEISISQSQLRVENDCFKYRQIIIINGKELSRKMNKAPKEFHQVEVYASSSPRSQPGVIKNFSFENKDTGSILNIKHIDKFCF